MFHQRCLENYLLILIAVYLIKAGVDTLCVFSTNYYNNYPELNEMVQKVIKAAQMYTNPYWMEVLPSGIFTPPYLKKIE